MVAMAACAARVPAPVVYKGVPQDPVPVPVVAFVPAVPMTASSPEVTTVQLRRPPRDVQRSPKLTLRSLIERNKTEVLLRFRAGPRRPRRGTHTVVAGETAYSISRRYGVDVASLARANDLGSSYRIRTGQDLRIPASRSPNTSSPQRQTASVANDDQREQRPAAQPGLPPRAGSFRWPVRGKILASYGPQAGGQHNDGINIGAPAGTPIVASEAGIVAYVGDDLESLGNLILIRHSGGWVTAYAHNEAVAVERGAQVARGDVIGRTGESGNVDRPQLHFEIRKETEAVDPLRYLGEQTAARR